MYLALRMVSQDGQVIIFARLEKEVFDVLTAVPSTNNFIRAKETSSRGPDKMLPNAENGDGISASLFANDTMGETDILKADLPRSTPSFVVGVLALTSLSWRGLAQSIHRCWEFGCKSALDRIIVRGYVYVSLE